MSKYDNYLIPEKQPVHTWEITGDGDPMKPKPKIARKHKAPLGNKPRSKTNKTNEAGSSVEIKIDDILAKIRDTKNTEDREIIANYNLNKKIIDILMHLNNSIIQILIVQLVLWLLLIGVGCMIYFLH